MNAFEVIEVFNKTHKPYAGFMSQSMYSSYMIRFKHGLLKPATLETFFDKMGYEKSDEGWRIKELNRKVA